MERVPATEPPSVGTYWATKGSLLAGPYPGAADPEGVADRVAPLLNAGIATFVNLMEVTETDHGGNPFTPYEGAITPQATMVRHPIHDLSVPTAATMTQILDTIDTALERGGVYVHCWGGVGRTGTVVGCWLLRHDLAEPDTVIDTIRELRRVDPLRGRRQSPETARQVQFVVEWHEA